MPKLTDQFHRFLRRHRRRIDPALEPRAGLYFNHIRWIDTHVQTQDQRHADRFHALLDAPTLRDTVDTFDAVQVAGVHKANRQLGIVLLFHYAGIGALVRRFDHRVAHSIAQEEGQTKPPSSPWKMMRKQNSVTQFER